MCRTAMMDMKKRLRRKLGEGVCMIVEVVDAHKAGAGPPDSTNVVLEGLEATM
jgi:hypothetical protein